MQKTPHNSKLKMMLAPDNCLQQLGMIYLPTPYLLNHLYQPQPVYPKQKGKKTNNQTETHRAGDWVCIICNNLNYSFRKVCNRCQTQTKKDNLIQSLKMLACPTPETPSKPEKVQLEDEDRSTQGSDTCRGPPGLKKKEEDTEVRLFRLFEDSEDKRLGCKGQETGVEESNCEEMDHHTVQRTLDYFMDD